MYHQDGVEFTLEGDEIPGFLKGSKKGNVFITTQKASNILRTFLYDLLDVIYFFSDEAIRVKTQFIAFSSYQVIFAPTTASNYGSFSMNFHSIRNVEVSF